MLNQSNNLVNGFVEFFFTEKYLFPTEQEAEFYLGQRLGENNFLLDIMEFEEKYNVFNS